MALLTHASRVPVGSNATITERAVSSLHVVEPGARVIMLEMTDVPSMDGTAVVTAQGLVG